MKNESYSGDYIIRTYFNRIFNSVIAKYSDYKRIGFTGVAANWYTASDLGYVMEDLKDWKNEIYGIEEIDFESAKKIFSDFIKKFYKYDVLQEPCNKFIKELNELYPNIQNNLKETVFETKKETNKLIEKKKMEQKNREKTEKERIEKERKEWKNIARIYGLNNFKPRRKLNLKVLIPFAIIILVVGLIIWMDNTGSLDDLIIQFNNTTTNLMNSLNETIGNYFCSDWTLYGSCSLNRPYYCNNGTLVENVSYCGCPSGQTAENNECISIYQTNPTIRTYGYTVRGNGGSITYTVYGGLNNYLANLPRTYTCTNGVCPPEAEIELRELNEETQLPYIQDFVDLIEAETSDKDEQARIAINLVQSIPYDYGSYYSMGTGRYPYEVLYDDTGVCGEKSKLLALILKELGFGVALYSFDLESHMAVGIQCDSQYSYEYSPGYCFIEATTQSMITDSEGDYLGAGQLTSRPTVYIISQGLTMDVSEEYNDFQEWQRLDSLGTVLNAHDYASWENLVAKYGMEIPGYNS